jgi:hypothetical protein
MRQTLLAALLCAITAGALAQTPPASPPAGAPAAQSPTCKSQAADKKLAGAALTSFMKKCQTDATASCDTVAADKFHQEVPRGRGRHLNDLRVAAGRGAGAQCPRYG